VAPMLIKGAMNGEAPMVAVAMTSLPIVYRLAAGASSPATGDVAAAAKWVWNKLF
jgi:hypothetical protein